MSYNVNDVVVIKKLNGLTGVVGAMFRIDRISGDMYYSAGKIPGSCWTESCLRPVTDREFLVFMEAEAVARYGDDWQAINFPGEPSKGFAPLVSMQHRIVYSKHQVLFRGKEGWSDRINRTVKQKSIVLNSLTMKPYGSYHSLMAIEKQRDDRLTEDDLKAKRDKKTSPEIKEVKSLDSKQDKQSKTQKGKLHGKVQDIQRTSITITRSSRQGKCLALREGRRAPVTIGHSRKPKRALSC